MEFPSSDLQKHERVKPTNGTIRCLCCRSYSHCSRLGYSDSVANSDNHINFTNNRTSDSKRVFQKNESISKECLCQRRPLCTPSKHSTSYDKSERVVCSPSQCTCFLLNGQKTSAYIQCRQTGNLNHGQISTNSFPEHNGYLSNHPNPTSVSRFHQSVCTSHFSDTEITTYPSIENDTDANMLSQSVSLTSFFSASSSHTQNMEKPIIYLTFSDKSKRHVREIKEFGEQLRDVLHFSVKCDNYDALRDSGELNVLQWRDTNFFKALWIIFCISPDYSETLHKSDTDSSESDKGVLYIYKVSRAEVYNNGSRNHRIIPVLFTKSGATVQDIPCFLSFSPFFEYPKHQQELFERLQYY